MKIWFINYNIIIKNRLINYSYCTLNNKQFTKFYFCFKTKNKYLLIYNQTLAAGKNKYKCPFFNLIKSQTFKKYHTKTRLNKKYIEEFTEKGRWWTVFIKHKSIKTDQYFPYFRQLCWSDEVPTDSYFLTL